MININVSEGNAVVIDDIQQQDKSKFLLKTLNAVNIGRLTLTGRKNLSNRLNSHTTEDDKFNLYENNFSFIMSAGSEENLISTIKAVDVYMSNQDILGLGFRVSLIINGIEKAGDKYVLVGAMYGSKVEGGKVVEMLNKLLDKEKNDRL